MHRRSNSKHEYGIEHFIPDFVRESFGRRMVREFREFFGLVRA